ncbi:MAG: DUF1700 domain-containing protein [Ruminococcaceae bacterium]|jgi:uncharacterized membrane protein|nr:DUF1700 domain-containing protein [Oscillospiraceae bacterium]
MNKDQFLLALYDELRGLPIEDVERSIAYYREMIDERVEDGMSEEEAVAALGSVQEIAQQILAEMPISSLVRERVTGGRRSLPAWEIVLLVLGAPLWFSLGIAALSILFAVYVTIWSLVLVLYAIPVALAIAAVACIGAIFFKAAFGTSQLLLLGGGSMVCGGLAVALVILFNGVARGVARASRSIWLWVKSLFVRKEIGA